MPRRKKHLNWREETVMMIFMAARWKDKLKAKLRDWCFADYKWVTRAQVQGILCCKMWEYRDDSIVSQHVRKVITEVREDIR